jgi:ParB family transcriptional regulator, chromosome partitioning protein
MIGKSLLTISENLSLTRPPAEIRDDCRKDTAVPKKVLVEIAKSKQQHGMRTLYKKYRESPAMRSRPRESARRRTPSSR